MDTAFKKLFPTTINTAEDMVEFGKKIATHIKSGDILALVGNLGAGKTHLVKGIASHFGITENVTSPTFNLIHEYPPTPLVHLDLYRLGTPDELLQIGWEDYIDQESILIAEWADKFPELFPVETIWINIQHIGPKRKLNLLDTL